MSATDEAPGFGNWVPAVSGETAARWRLRLICCGRDDGTETFDAWEDADAFRESYTTGPGVGLDDHDRAAIIEENPPPVLPLRARRWIGRSAQTVVLRQGGAS